MKRTFSTRIIAGIATSAVLAVGSLSFMAINAIADEAVSYYGLSSDGTVISGTVTDYTKIASTDTAWGTAGKETWYVADGIVNIITTTYDYDNHKNVYNPVEIKGNVNVILKNGAEVSVVNGIAGTDATITFYSESESASGVIGFIGAYGDNGEWGSTDSGSVEANGDNGVDGKVAVNVSSFTVAGGTVTVIGGNGGKGGDAGYNTDHDTNEKYYGIGGNGGNGGAAITDNTKVYLNGGRLNVTAGRGGNPGTNTNVPSEQQDNYKGEQGAPGKAVGGIYAVNGILNVNKSDNSDATDVSGDYELYSVNAPIGSHLDIQSRGTTFVNDGTIIMTRGDISVANKLEVEGAIRINGNIIPSSQAEITKSGGGVISRIKPGDNEGFTLDSQNGLIIPDAGHSLVTAGGVYISGNATADMIMAHSNRFGVCMRGDGVYIDDSEPNYFSLPYCIAEEATENVSKVSGDVFANAGTNSSVTFAVTDPDEYVLTGVTVTDYDGNEISSEKYTFDCQTGVFTALSIDCNMIVKANAQLKDVKIAVTDEDGEEILYSAGFSTVYDNGTSAEPFTFKIKVTEGGSIAKYRVVKESDLNKASGVITDTSSFTVSYTAGNEWGTADDGSSKIAKGETATFTVKPKSNLDAGTYTEDFIVITDRTAYADASAGTQDKALARFTLTYKVEHESDGKLHYSDLTGHYNLCKNCQAKINKVNHTFDIRTVNENTLATPADCVNPAKYFYSCECGAHTNDTTLVFENGDPNNHTFGDWEESEPATCTTGGKEKHICSVCRAEEERDTSPLGHDWKNDYTIDVKPTCTNPGSKSIHCSRCDATKDEKEVDPSGHTLGDWEADIPAGCLTSGRDKRKCSVCEYEETREIEPTGHIWEDDFTIDIKPGCTEKGSKSVHCSKCDEKKDITEVPANGHSFGEWTILNMTDCTQGGVQQHICTECGFTEISDIPPQEHTWDADFTVDLAPTCTQSGSKSIHCSSCEAVKDITEIKPIDHVFTEWSVSSDATCVEKGQKTRSCTECGYTEYDSIDIDLNAHLWEDDFTIDKEPTCKADGSRSIHCSRCNATKDSEPIPAAAHQYGEWKVVKKATCTENGKRVRECANCGKNEEDIIPPTHIWDKKVTVDKEPTCTEDGSQSIHCTQCNAQKDIQKLSAKGHDWSEWKITKKPTTVENGVEERHCQVCGVVETNELDIIKDNTSDSKPETPGSDINEWHCDGSHHWHIDLNGNRIDYAYHEFVWITDTEPTGTQPGIGHYVCIACDYTTSPEEFSKDSPETGSNSLALWIAAAFVAGGVAPIALKIKSKKSK